MNAGTNNWKTGVGIIWGIGLPSRDKYYTLIIHVSYNWQTDNNVLEELLSLAKKMNVRVLNDLSDWGFINCIVNMFSQGVENDEKLFQCENIVWMQRLLIGWNFTKNLPTRQNPPYFSHEWLADLEAICHAVKMSSVAWRGGWCDGDGGGACASQRERGFMSRMQGRICREECISQGFQVLLRDPWNTSGTRFYLCVWITGVRGGKYMKTGTR